MPIEWRLVDVMKERKMRNKEFAEKSGLHPVTVSNLKHTPPKEIKLETLNKICEALECRPGDIIGWKTGSRFLDNLDDDDEDTIEFREVDSEESARDSQKESIASKNIVMDMLDKQLSITNDKSKINAEMINHLVRLPNSSLPLDQKALIANCILDLILGTGQSVKDEMGAKTPISCR